LPGRYVLPPVYIPDVFMLQRLSHNVACYHALTGKVQGRYTGLNIWHLVIAGLLSLMGYWSWPCCYPARSCIRQSLHLRQRSTGDDRLYNKRGCWQILPDCLCWSSLV